MAALRPLRSLAPRASLALHSKQLLPARLSMPRLRHASTTTPPPKPRLLEKPDRFNPPSHGARMRTKPRYYGAPLSHHERTAQKTRRYPHMMPPEGSFMFYFLTDRTIHLFITLGILLSLVGAIWYKDFLTQTPYTDLLPPNSMLFAHPIAFFRRWAEVYGMHVSYISAQTAERRRAKMDDVAKRSEYRKVHGIGQEEGVFGGWTAKSEREVMGPAFREGGGEGVGQVVAVRDASPVAVPAATAGVEAQETFIDFDGKRQPAIKKWFGIW
ncbi:hypothetical protein LTR91_007636 [Friedmanniomyces endolithicus]|uniref:Uncharacterized protein n=2 Tax=Friedmanniomyces endolithicus TaxID=329885 RepID=A0AAN6J8F4_9PEZI|nr:hypothetical protein LTS09_000605 [Friedmanniomyces endolithicus]KAK0274039.1 hypothetical protein LTR35_011831 [Friedmanniomyces endolithicus]KAK0293227.1 hypothetical protein LTS00_007472 [Friedmanniomyces endolithicus]KAK0313235.1 hypothetical protein LTR82_013667 [Friedmanniomyces endolithicus]KAK0913653.1 hypothetical protein LTR57_014304 [Friedmanniomyces endolithicus]